jgi:protein TonB
VAEDGLRLYGEAIRARILAHKPSRIRLYGTVGLTFSVSTDGRLLAVAVSMSSGSDILDQAALAAVQEAAPFPPLPEGTAEQQLTFSIPFHFR